MEDADPESGSTFFRALTPWWPLIAASKPVDGCDEPTDPEFVEGDSRSVGLFIVPLVIMQIIIVRI